MEELGNKLSSMGRTTRLKTGIHLKELLEKCSTEFTLDASQLDDCDYEKDYKTESVFDFEDFAPFVNLDCIGTGDDDSHSSPFETLKTKMTPITDDGKLLKKILRCGNDKTITPSCVVYFHYNSYLEMEEVPFDSSYLRQEKPVRMQFGVDSMYYGFEKSLMSMRVGEKSQFLVDPSYAFGKMGVPPRIPENAFILLEIELFKIVDGCDNNVTDSPVKENKKFSDCYDEAKRYHAIGNDFFSQENYPAAIKNYKNAERVLLSCVMNGDEEEEQLKQLLLKMYLNMCLVYGNPKMNNPERVCHYGKQAFLNCHDLANKSAKLHFRLGKAQMALNDLENAKISLKKSLSLEPNNQEIGQALAELEKKCKKSFNIEKATYQKMFGFKPTKKEVEILQPEDDFVSTIKQELQKFAAGRASRFMLPPGLTKEERKICKALVDELGLKWEDIVIRGSHKISIFKYS